LAKMNLLVHNLRGEITEANSYDSDPYESYGKFDFVMANPPFNVKSVKESTVKNDKRFYQYGLPKNKGKKDDKISDANYLWISLFATSLNNNGRAGFVMPNSASDARNAEYEIRKKIVDSGIVDCMVSMPSNMFLTVTLPATLWFFDKAKVHTDRKDKILFLDARNVFNQIDRAHREWTPEQQQNLAAIVRLYRGETAQYLELIANYMANAFEAQKDIAPTFTGVLEQLNKVLRNLKAYAATTKDEKRTPAKTKALKEANFFEALENFDLSTYTRVDTVETPQKPPMDNNAQKQWAAALKTVVENNEERVNVLKTDVNKLVELHKIADKHLKLKGDKVWSSHNLPKADKALEEALQVHQEASEQFGYWNDQIEWLQSRFPEAKYKDVVGLCKMADRTEFAKEQDYSLNAGRYVGILIDKDETSEKDFARKISQNLERLKRLNYESQVLENTIEEGINGLIG